MAVDADVVGTETVPADAVLLLSSIALVSDVQFFSSAANAGAGGLNGLGFDWDWEAADAAAANLPCSSGLLAVAVPVRSQHSQLTQFC